MFRVATACKLLFCLTTGVDADFYAVAAPSHPSLGSKRRGKPAAAIVYVGVSEVLLLRLSPSLLTNVGLSSS